MKLAFNYCKRQDNKGNQVDWEGIYRLHSAGIFQYLLSMTGNREEAEDLLQETFIRAMRYDSKLRDLSKIKSWMMTIARNIFIDLLRKKKVRGMAAAYDENQEVFDSIPDETPNPADLSEQSNFRMELQQVLRALPENYRTAFTLGVVQRLTYQEIEDITGWNQQMVKTNIFRARKKVASELRAFQNN